MNPIATIVLGLALAASGVSGQSDSAPESEGSNEQAISERARLFESPEWDDPIEFEFSPRFHYMSPSGGFFLNGSQRVPVDFAKINDPRATPGWHMEAVKGRYRIDTEGFVFRIAGQATPVSNFVPNVPAGSLARTELELTSAEVRFGYDVVSRRFGSEQGEYDALRVTLTPRVGLRLIDFKLSVEQVGNPSARDSTAVTLVEPTIGIAGSLLFEERFKAGVAVDIGSLPEIGGVESSSASIEAEIGYRLNDRWSLRGGYRLLIQDVINDDVDFDGSLAGVYLGFSVRF